jgi:diphthine synthase
MLFFIGLGISGYNGISLLALNALKTCTIIYIERFTSAICDQDILELDKAVRSEDKGITMLSVQRWFVEDGREILERALDQNVALVTYGDPLIATTHTELYIRAVKNSINVNILHAASGVSSVIGETGLHMYKFGRSVTMMSTPLSALSVYNTIFDNLLAGNHTLILTEYNDVHPNGLFFLDPVRVCNMLMEAERDLKYNIFSEETFMVVASRIGTSQKKIISGKVKSLTGMNFGTGPHSLIVTGGLHFTEEEALTTLTYNADKPIDNAANIQRVSVRMLEKYAPRTKKTAEETKRLVRAGKYNISTSEGLIEAIENAEYYISDAERFLRQGKFELAVLSMGYAEGLIDSLRFQKGLLPESP